MDNPLTPAEMLIAAFFDRWEDYPPEEVQQHWERDLTTALGKVLPAIEAAAVERERERLRRRLARPRGLLEGALSQVQQAAAKRDINRGGLEEVLAEVVAALDPDQQPEPLDERQERLEAELSDTEAAIERKRQEDGP